MGEKLLRIFKSLIKRLFTIDTYDLKLMPMITALSFSVVYYYISQFNFDLIHFADRAIGISILNGIDPSLRQTAYLSSFILFWVSFALLKMLFSICVHHLLKNVGEHKVDALIHVGFELSLIWIFAIIYNLTVLFGPTNNNLIQLVDYQLATVPFLLLCEWFVLIILYIQPFKKIDPFFESKFELWILLLFPIPLLFAIGLLRSDGQSIYILGKANLLSAYGLMMLLSFLPKNWLDKRRFLFHSHWLFIIPIAHIIGSEIQYSYKTNAELTTLWISKVILFVLIALFLVSYGLSIHRAKTINLKKHIENVIAPLLIVVFFILTYHKTSIEVGFLDLVGYGNKVTPVQQFLHFGSIPLVDYWGAQHFEIGVLLYSLIHGMNALEPIVWIDIRNILIMLIFYFSFRRLWGARWTFLFILFLPAMGFINIYYFGAFLPMLYFRKLIFRKGWKDYFIFTILSLIAFVWMPSMGKISILASLVVMLGSLKNRKDIVNFLAGAGFAYIATVTIYVALVVLKGYDLSNHITLIKAFSAIDYDVGAYPSLIAGDTIAWEAISVYALFPLLYAVYALYFVFKKEKGENDLFMLFMVVASAVSSLRQLGRHSLFEGQVGYDFILIILLSLVLQFRKVRLQYRQTGFVLLSLFYLLLLQESSQLIAVNALNTKTIKNYALDEVRYVPNKLYFPTRLVEILKTSLKGEETFYDNQNGNLLFELTDKKQPFLHHSAQMIYSESPQEVYIELFKKKLQDQLIPIIVFDGEWWGADTDGIPTEFSTFKLTEFIYENYHPWISVDGYNLWISNTNSIEENFDASQYAGVEKISRIVQNFDMKELPYIWANFDEKFSENLPKVLYESDFGVPAGAVNLDVPIELIKGRSNYLYLTITSELTESVEAKLTYNGKNHATFSVLPGRNNYAIRMSTQYDWFNGTIENLTLNIQDTIQLDKVQILEGD